MVFPITYHNEKLCSKPKGIKQVLIECGKWSPGGLILDCKKCKEKIQDISRTTCCARRVISLEPDFIAQKGAIEELIEKAGHKYIFFPKFHCELNFIERRCLHTILKYAKSSKEVAQKSLCPWICPLW
ncbi:hypothetical protein RhiirC2_721147 [Rhizophagus irregularis]|uniref:Uncharacterized protein n=1 Tax=Rhizophagus irregularis TaxID=588596 RepID=A0A2N1M7E1_9GLOM|nr:hypothetical protein RhiirC2_721147 [Rhizophagus irregularis]